MRTIDRPTIGPDSDQLQERKQGITLDSKDHALLAARIASDKKAEDIIVIDVAKLLVVTDYFVICTGNNERHVRTIAEEIEIQLKKAGLPPIGVEGGSEGKWILIDFVDLVVHVFQPAERDFYRLERLWSDAPRVPLPPDMDGPAPVSSAEGSAEEDETVSAEAGKP